MTLRYLALRTVAEKEVSILALALGPSYTRSGGSLRKPSSASRAHHCARTRSRCSYAALSPATVGSDRLSDISLIHSGQRSGDHWPDGTRVVSSALSFFSLFSPCWKPTRIHSTWLACRARERGNPRHDKGDWKEAAQLVGFNTPDCSAHPYSQRNF